MNPPPLLSNKIKVFLFFSVLQHLNNFFSEGQSLFLRIILWRVVSNLIMYLKFGLQCRALSQTTQCSASCKWLITTSVNNSNKKTSFLIYTNGKRHINHTNKRQILNNRLLTQDKCTTMQQVSIVCSAFNQYCSQRKHFSFCVLYSYNEYKHSFAGKCK